MNRQVQMLQFGAERARVRRRIQEYLDAQHMSFAQLAASIGVTRQAVYKTMSGQIHSPRVLQGLREMGVPEHYLFDPKNHTPHAPAPVVKPQADLPTAQAV